MSLSSFSWRVLREPSYAWRRVWWEWLKTRPERELSALSKYGKMTFSSKDQAIGRTIYLDGDFALSDVKKTMRLLIDCQLILPQGNSLLLDIGANIGTICIPLVSQNYFKQALAFEPGPQNVELLRKNLFQNNILERVTVVPCGLSSENGEALLSLSPVNYGNHQIQSSLPGTGASRTDCVAVPIRTLDSVLAEKNIPHSAVSMIWIDTQGHEGKILSRAQELLKLGVPIVTEFWPYGLREAGTSVDEFCSIFEPYYNFFFDLGEGKLNRRSIKELPQRAQHYGMDEIRYTDFVFLREPQRGS